MKHRAHGRIFRRLDRVIERWAADKAAAEPAPWSSVYSLWPHLDDGDARRAEMLFDLPHRTPDQDVELQGLFAKAPEAESILSTRKPGAWRLDRDDWLL